MTTTPIIAITRSTRVSTGRRGAGVVAVRRGDYYAIWMFAPSNRWLTR